MESVREKLSAIGTVSPAMAAHLDQIERELTERLPDALVLLRATSVFLATQLTTPPQRE